MIPNWSLARLQNLRELLWNTKNFKASVTVGFLPLQAPTSKNFLRNNRQVNSERRRVVHCTEQGARAKVKGDKVG